MRPIRSARLSSSSTTSTRAAAAGPGSPLLQAGHGGADDSPFASPVFKGRIQPPASTSSAGMTRSRSGRQVRPPAPRDRVDVNGHDNDDDDDDDEVPVRRARSKRASLWSPRATPRKSSETNGKASSSRHSTHSSAASSSRKDDAAAKAAAASTEEARAKQEEEERKMLGKWAEEYYEIVEQLPLELHRSFTLMRELETKLQEKNLRVATQVKEYRDARIALRNLTSEQRTQMLKAEAERAQKEKAEAPALAPPSEAGRATSAGSQLDVQELLMQGSSTDADAEGEDAAEVYHELAGEAYVPQPYAYELPLVPQVNQGAAPVSSSLSSDSDALVVPLGAAAGDEDVKMAEAGDDDDDGGVAPSRAARLLLLSDIAQASSDALRIADEKIGLAVTAYEWVDRQIRRLDGDLQKSENGLLLGLRAGTEASRGLQDALGVSLDGSGDKDAPGRWDEVETLLLGHPANDRSAVAQRKGKKRGRKGASQGVANANVGEEEDDVNATTGMAIDPNEPTYCYCDQVSFGDMVACDNEDCPREWFHYHCVGFTQPPKGRWFCLFCAPAVGFKGAGTFPPDAPCLPEGLAKKSGVGGRKGKR